MYLSDYIKNLKGVDVMINRNYVSFRSSFLGWNWEKFSQIDKGTFSLTDTSLTFKFYMYWLFIFSGAMSVCIIYISKEIYLGALVFIFLGIGNWLIALVRMKNMMKELSKNINAL